MISFNHDDCFSQLVHLQAVVVVVPTAPASSLMTVMWNALENKGVIFLKVFLSLFIDKVRSVFEGNPVQGFRCQFLTKSPQKLV